MVGLHHHADRLVDFGSFGVVNVIVGILLALMWPTMAGVLLALMWPAFCVVMALVVWSVLRRQGD